MIRARLILAYALLSLVGCRTPKPEPDSVQLEQGQKPPALNPLAGSTAKSAGIDTSLSRAAVQLNPTSKTGEERSKDVATPPAKPLTARQQRRAKRQDNKNAARVLDAQARLAKAQQQPVPKKLGDGAQLVIGEQVGDVKNTPAVGKYAVAASDSAQAQQAAKADQAAQAAPGATIEQQQTKPGFFAGLGSLFSGLAIAVGVAGAVWLILVIIRRRNVRKVLEESEN